MIETFEVRDLQDLHNFAEEIISKSKPHTFFALFGEMGAGKTTLIKSFCKQLGVDENEVTPNARFIDDLGADSLDTVELVMRFEEEFGIEIPDEDAEKIQSVRDAYNYIDQHKGK